MSNYNTNNNQNNNNKNGSAADAFCGLFGGAALAVPAWWLGIKMCQGSKDSFKNLGGIVILVAIVLSIFTVKFFIEWIVALGKSVKRGVRGESKPGEAGQAVIVAIIIILGCICFFGLVKTVRDGQAKAEADKAKMNSWSGSKSYSNSSGSKSTGSSSSSKSSTTTGSKVKKERDTSYNATHSTYHRSSSDSSSKRTIDPDDLDVEGYYEDYKSEFEDVDDAWDDLMDNPDLWEDYEQ